jgi:hypothetical protein
MHLNEKTEQRFRIPNVALSFYNCSLQVELCVKCPVPPPECLTVSKVILIPSFQSFHNIFTNRSTHIWLYRFRLSYTRRKCYSRKNMYKGSSQALSTLRMHYFSSVRNNINLQSCSQEMRILFSFYIILYIFTNAIYCIFYVLYLFLIMKVTTVGEINWIGIILSVQSKL